MRPTCLLIIIRRGQNIVGVSSESRLQIQFLTYITIYSTICNKDLYGVELARMRDPARPGTAGRQCCFRGTAWQRWRHAARPPTVPGYHASSINQIRAMAEPAPSRPFRTFERHRIQRVGDMSYSLRADKLMQRSVGS